MSSSVAVGRLAPPKPPMSMRVCATNGTAPTSMPNMRPSTRTRCPTVSSFMMRWWSDGTRRIERRQDKGPQMRPGISGSDLQEECHHVPGLLGGDNGVHEAPGSRETGVELVVVVRTHHLDLLSHRVGQWGAGGLGLVDLGAVHRH